MKRIETRAVHGMSNQAEHGAFNVGIVQNSTFAQTVAGEWDEYTYGRTNNPTEQALRVALADLTGATRAVTFASGLAAISATFDLLEPGSLIVSMSDIYGGTYRLLSKFARKRDLRVEFIDLSDPASLESPLLTEASMIFCETPSNPLLKVTDIRKLSAIAEESEALLVVDNTVATPVNQLPLNLGADIVVHSLSKYLSGHTNVVGGALVMNSEDLYDRLRFIRKATGANLGPMDSYLTMVGMKTLPLRMAQHQANASQVAEYLVNSDKCTGVRYLGFENHPQADLIASQMVGYGGIVSFELPTVEDAAKVANSLELFSRAVSFGSVASLMSHPYSMSHKDIPEGEGVAPELLRLSVGIEAIEDLLADLDRSLAGV